MFKGAEAWIMSNYFWRVGVESWRQGLERGSATREAVACGTFHVLMDLIPSRSQALTD